MRELRKAEGWHKGERADRVAKAQALTDHWEVINDAFQRPGISAEVLLDEGRAGMDAFREAVPTIFASSELERLRHSASQKARERQDLNDISARPLHVSTATSLSQRGLGSMRHVGLSLIRGSIGPLSTT